MTFKTPWPKADNARVLRPYSEDMIRLNRRGAKVTVRPSGYNIKSTVKRINPGGVIPPNVAEEILTEMLKAGNNASNDTYTKLCKEKGIKIHPTRFPASLPSFYIKLLTNEEDIVLDPFAGSNTTGAVAESLQRRWLAVDNVERILKETSLDS